ncbi:CoA-binding protein [Caldalkalibacillus salinus]|uniref:CoA-binding protein n=1 Tax=Caldalkalibacillus salinus TaxID=2803787 RepID=UPI001924B421|nr:CoA-binding protein [Caldalkalibacillus salinus]
MGASREEIKQVLSQAQNIAVVGLSDKPHRTSYQVSAYMQRMGYHIIPINPNITSSLGQKAYASLDEVPEHIDIVNVFRKSPLTVEPARQAVAHGAKCLWLQLGIFNEEAYQIATEGGLSVMMDACIMVEHQNL